MLLLSRHIWVPRPYRADKHHDGELVKVSRYQWSYPEHLEIGRYFSGKVWNEETQLEGAWVTRQETQAGASSLTSPSVRGKLGTKWSKSDIENWYRVHTVSRGGYWQGAWYIPIVLLLPVITRPVTVWWRWWKEKNFTILIWMVRMCLDER